MDAKVSRQGGKVGERETGIFNTSSSALLLGAVKAEFKQTAREQTETDGRRSPNKVSENIHVGTDRNNVL